jgi:hypothetical protein
MVHTCKYHLEAGLGHMTCRQPEDRDVGAVLVQGQTQQGNTRGERRRPSFWASGKKSRRTLIGDHGRCNGAQPLGPSRQVIPNEGYQLGQSGRNEIPTFLFEQRIINKIGYFTDLVI